MGRTASPIHAVEFRGHRVFVKRDDLLRLAPASAASHQIADFSGFNGNKARKLAQYLNPTDAALQRRLAEVRRIVSFGSAQSNMLYSLSCLAHLRDWELTFYVDHVADYLRQNPSGNYAAALANGARVIEVGAQRVRAGERHLNTYVQRRHAQGSADILFIPEGGANEQAETGVAELAREIGFWVEQNQIPNPVVMLPSGTGTTALYLSQHLEFEVVTCACVGSNAYLEQQFRHLKPQAQRYPKILRPQAEPARAHYRFGRCYPELFALWQALQQDTGICFDLLYDPLGWLCLLEYLDRSKHTLTPIYVHQGGLLGNTSMEARYRRQTRVNT